VDNQVNDAISSLCKYLILNHAVSADPSRNEDHYEGFYEFRNVIFTMTFSKILEFSLGGSFEA
jgi:hypothetical protein